MPLCTESPTTSLCLNALNHQRHHSASICTESPPTSLCLYALNHQRHHSASICTESPTTSLCLYALNHPMWWNYNACENRTGKRKPHWRERRWTWIIPITDCIDWQTTYMLHSTFGEPISYMRVSPMITRHQQRRSSAINISLCSLNSTIKELTGISILILEQRGGYISYHANTSLSLMNLFLLRTFCMRPLETKIWY
jgi:hypothetical protein